MQISEHIAESGRKHWHQDCTWMSGVLHTVGQLCISCEWCHRFNLFIVELGFYLPIVSTRMQWFGKKTSCSFVIKSDCLGSASQELPRGGGYKARVSLGPEARWGTRGQASCIWSREAVSRSRRCCFTNAIVVIKRWKGALGQYNMKQCPRGLGIAIEFWFDAFPWFPYLLWI